MKTIQADEIAKVVSELCKKACYHVTPDMRAAFEKARENETSCLSARISWASFCKMPIWRRKRSHRSAKTPV